MSVNNNLIEYQIIFIIFCVYNVTSKLGLKTALSQLQVSHNFNQMHQIWAYNQIIRGGFMEWGVAGGVPLSILPIFDLPLMLLYTSPIIKL